MLEDKFNTCVFRDGPDECVEKATCCSSEKVDTECYFCLEPSLLIVGLKPKICEACIYYKNKLTIKNQKDDW